MSFVGKIFICERGVNIVAPLIFQVIDVCREFVHFNILVFKHPFGANKIYNPNMSHIDILDSSDEISIKDLPLYIGWGVHSKEYLDILKGVQDGNEVHNLQA
jgi:hypothetical protein